MRYFDIVVKFIDTSREAPDTFSLAVAFEHAVEKFGVKHFACVSHVDWHILPPGTVALSNYPEEWIAHFIGFGLAQLDPVFQRVEAEFSPFSWNDAEWRSSLSRAQQQIFHEASRRGLEYGVTVPLHLAGSAPASCSFVFERAQIDPQCVHALHLMAAYLYEAGRGLEPLPVVLPYGPGYPECLRVMPGDIPRSADPTLADILARHSR